MRRATSSLLLSLATLSILGSGMTPALADVPENQRPLTPSSNKDSRQGDFFSKNTQKQNNNLPAEADLALPAVSDDMHNLAVTIQEQLASDPNFASVAISLDRKKLTVYWYGNDRQNLKKVLASNPRVKVEILQSSLNPAELREAAAALIADADNLGVGSVGIALDGSALNVELSEEAPQAEILETIVEVPLVIGTDGAPETAAGRQLDDYNIGGARIKRFEDPFVRGECTSGFAVERFDNSSQQGMMFAAHCGAVDSRWITSDNTFAYNYGTVVTRVPSYDGAIISTRFSQPGVYVSDWQSNVATSINGVRQPVVGSELCYSGSYSGLTCGNIVQGFVTTNLTAGGSSSADLGAVSSVRTQQVAGIPSVGNGDSGGPGYLFTTSSTGATQRFASTIISAITAGTSTCRGVPGVEGTTGRKCSATAFSTSVQSIAGISGWKVRTVP